MKMCNRNYDPMMRETATVMDDGIDLKKVHAAMYRDPEGMYQYLTILMHEAKTVWDDPSFVIPDDDLEETDDMEEPGFFMEAPPAADRQEDDLLQGLDALKNDQMSPEEKREFIYRLCEAIVAEGRPQSKLPLPFTATSVKPTAVEKPKRRPRKKNQ